MDCGAEFKLLDPSFDPILTKTHIAVEIHEAYGSSDEIVRRFSQTHSIQKTAALARTLSDLPGASTALISPAASV
jgi:hypothetical protein